jgi:hypothetical protein
MQISMKAREDKILISVITEQETKKYQLGTSHFINMLKKVVPYLSKTEKRQLVEILQADKPPVKNRNKWRRGRLNKLDAVGFDGKSMRQMLCKCNVTAEELWDNFNISMQTARKYALLVNQGGLKDGKTTGENNS